MVKNMGYSSYTKERNKKISESLKEQHKLGKRNDIYEKISKSKKGKKRTDIIWNKGKKGMQKHTEEYKRKMSILMKEKRKNNFNYSSGMLNKKHTNESKIKIGNSNKQYKGEQKGNWRGGISFEPYSVNWTNTLKRGIKERDEFTCQLCKDKNKSVFIHHIDYNKMNCSLNNLISLCSSCHSKTNFNREKWKQIFKQMMI